MRRRFGLLKRTVAVGFVLAAAAPAFAGPDDALAWVADDGAGIGTGTGDWTDSNNWKVDTDGDGIGDGANDVPNSFYGYIVIDGGGTAIIPEDAGTIQFGALNLGEFPDESGHVIMNGGHLIIGSQETDDRTLINSLQGSSVESSFIMNGGQIDFGGPDQNPGCGNCDGQGLDWEVGEKGPGRFEQYGGVFNIGDDLKVAEDPDPGDGLAIIGGTAVTNIGSGISVGSDTSNAIMTVNGTAVVNSGNSMGLGSPQGSSDEGYLTMATGAGAVSVLNIEESGTVNVRSLQARDGSSTINLKDNGSLNIFNVFTGSGTEDYQGLGFIDTSSFGSTGGSDVLLSIEGNASLTVDSTDGLTIAGVERRRLGNPGGTGELRVQDSGTVTTVQDLRFADAVIGNTSTASGTMTIVGPDATIDIGTDLLFNPNRDAGATTTFVAEITASTHSTVEVGGHADIGAADLVVKLNGYSPVAGDLYTLIEAGDFTSGMVVNNGDDTFTYTPDAVQLNTEFASVDFSEAALSEGMLWLVKYDATTVQLLATVLGDMDGNGTLDAFDVGAFEIALADPSAYAAQYPGLDPDVLGDFDNSGVLDAFDVSDFEVALANVGASVPEPASLGMLALVGVLLKRRR